MGVFKILMPIIIVLPGVIGYYYFKETLYPQPGYYLPCIGKKSVAGKPCWFFCSGCFGYGVQYFECGIEQRGYLIQFGCLQTTN